MESVVQVKLGDYRSPIWVRAQAGNLAMHDLIIVDIQKTIEFAKIILDPRKVCHVKDDQVAGHMIRTASDADLKQVATSQIKAEEALDICRAKIKTTSLDMQLVSAEYTFDMTKLLIFFTSEGRVDFRHLVKDLAKQFRVRIELKQIGVRDRAKIISGYGVCGRELCCSSFMKDFNSLSIKMAKEQGLPLNPQKISGVCGRVKCCMAYEYNVYREFSKNLPKLGGKYTTPEGVKAKVVSVDILKRNITIDLGEGKMQKVVFPPLKPTTEGENPHAGASSVRQN